MVDDYANYEAEEARMSKERDEKYATLLAEIEKVLGVKLKSFDDLPYIPANLMIDRVMEFIDVVNHAAQKEAGEYAIRSLIYHKTDTDSNLDFNALFAIYTLLAPRYKTASLVRTEVAGSLCEAMTPLDFERYLSLFSTEENSTDMNLLGGLLKIKDRKFDNRIIEVLRKAIRMRDGAWMAARVIKRKRHIALLPELKTARAGLDDRDTEIKQEIEKAITSLTRFKEKREK